MLAGSFIDDAAITRVVKEIYNSCPMLFSTLLPRSEQLSLEGSLILENDDDDDESVQADRQHGQPTVTGCIQTKHCREVLKLPTRASHLSASFSSSLSKAYDKYYHMPNIIAFSQGSIQWSKKLSFFDPDSQRRQTFKMGDFIMERDRGNNEIVRICHILIHNWAGARRLFVKGVRITAEYLSASEDSVLGSGYRRLRLPDSAATHESAVLIGLPAILPRQLYIVPIAAKGEGFEIANVENAQEFLWAERTLQWL